MGNILRKCFWKAFLSCKAVNQSVLPLGKEAASLGWLPCISVEDFRSAICHTSQSRGVWTWTGPASIPSRKFSFLSCLSNRSDTSAFQNWKSSCPHKHQGDIKSCQEAEGLAPEMMYPSFVTAFNLLLFPTEVRIKNFSAAKTLTNRYLEKRGQF